MYIERMYPKILLAALTLIFASVFLTGCAKKSVQVSGETPVEEVSAQEGTALGEGPGGITGEEPIEEVAVTYGEGNISEGRTSAPLLPIYFDFDRYNIRDDMKERMEKNAAFLLDHPEVRIEIQGNCDDRGTNEYNLALGEKRAKSVRDYLVNLGIVPDRLEMVSFGEERPVDPGQNEEAWAKNRRDDLVIIR
ncbi:MAG TPA: peptidoglycan-associated lipoprotein Pal [Thermodesulfobacteriaceae bacterium]|nr:peptidoglycan-associated lipoprotein Pal [Thermodesulfobacteriaceae bacterium]